MNGFRYRIDLAWSGEDGGYIATVPELLGVSAFGETPERATEEVVRAARAYVEVLDESGSAVPPPQELSTFSGQFRVRLPVSMHAALVNRARHEGVSLNTLVVSLVAEGLGARGDRLLDGIACSGEGRGVSGAPR